MLGFEAILSYLESGGRGFEAFLVPFMARFVAEGSHFAAGIALALIVIAFAYGVFILLIRVFPTWQSLRHRKKAVETVLGSATIGVERRKTFAKNYAEQIDPSMSFGSTSKNPFHNLLQSMGDEKALRLAWSELKETFILDDDDDEIRNTVRPQEYIIRSVKNPQRSKFAAIFVSLGLLLTFVGIISVLMKAGCDLRGSENSSSTVCEQYNEAIVSIEKDLNELDLTIDPRENDLADVQDANQIASDSTSESGPGEVDGEDNGPDTEAVVLAIVGGAASKFYASIGGLAASLLLRVMLGFFSNILRREVELLTDQLESGLAFMPEQTIALQQLQNAREQSNQLKTFNTDLAVSISHAIQPVTDRLENIQTALSEQNEATLGAITSGVGEAIDNMAGGEIRELGRVLGDLRSELSGLTEKMSEGGSEAAEKMGLAAKSLGDVAERVKQNLKTISEQAAEAGASINKEMVESAKNVGESLTRTVAEISAASRSNTEAFAELKGELQSLASNVSAEAEEKIRAAIEKSAEATASAATEAGETLKNAFEEASENWLKSIDVAIERIGALSQQMQRSASSIGEHASQVDRAAEATSDASTALGSAADSLREVTTPVSEVITQCRSTARAIDNAMSQLSETLNKSLTEVSSLTENLNGTAVSAEQAWIKYDERFGQTDQQLERVLKDITGALESNAARMKKYIEEIDGEMAKAVTNFASVVQPLTEFAEQLEDALESARSGGNGRGAP